MNGHKLPKFRFKFKTRKIFQITRVLSEQLILVHLNVWVSNDVKEKCFYNCLKTDLKCQFIVLSLKAVC